MTNDDVERAISFLLESQAALAASQSTLASTVNANTEAIARLTSLAERHDVEVVAMRQDMLGMQTEVRDAVATMLGAAESMAENVRTLTAMQIETRRRVDAIEENRQ